MTEAGEILRSYMMPALEQIDRGVRALRGNGAALSLPIRLVNEGVLIF